MITSSENLSRAISRLSRRSFVASAVAAASATVGKPWLAAAGADPQPIAQGPPQLCRATVVELANLIRRRKVSSLEVVNAYLARIEQVNPKLNAVVRLEADRARDAARRADLAISRGGDVGPLHGVPMTIKDSLDTAGTITTGGTIGRKAFVPGEDATVVARLRSAGAILMGKTNMPEFGWSWETRSPVHGRTNNPWNLEFSPGGSSGGAAAIVAACGSPFDIGSDTGGSIRLPAHFCGISGIKPTVGRVPRTGHIIGPDGYLQALTQLGPMARSVDDLALILSVIAGPDGKDAAIVPATLGDHKKVELRGLRVAFHVDNGLREPSPDVAKAVTASREALQARGVVVEEERPDALKEVLSLDEDLYRADGASDSRGLLELAGTKEPGPDVAASLKQTGHDRP